MKLINSIQTDLKRIESDEILKKLIFDWTGSNITKI